MHEIVARNAPFTKELWSRERRQGLLQEEGRDVQDRAGRRHPRGRGPEDLQAGRVARSLPRPAHDLDRADRQGLQAHPLRGLLLARQSRKARKLQRIYGTAWASRAGAGGLPQADRGGREARPPQARPRDGPLPFPGGGAGRRVLAPEGLGAVPEPHQLHPPAAERGRLSRGERAADPRQVDVGDLGPLGDLPREHVHHRHRGRARVRHQADELPGPRADLQARAALLSRAALSRRRVRHRASLRAVGRAARADARARLHPGRCARLLHRGAARRRVPEDERPHPVDLSRLRLRGGGGQALDPAGEAGRLRRAVGSGGSRHVGSAEADRGQVGRQGQDRHQPGRGRLLRPEVRVRAARCHRPRLAVRHHPGRLQPAGAASAPSTSTPTARRRRRS